MPFTVTIETIERSGKMLNVEYNYNNKAYTRKLPLFGPNIGVAQQIEKEGTGTKWSVTTQKNDKGFDDWTSIAPAKEGDKSMPRYNTESGGRFESPEERARRQVYIIRQSSLSTAAEVLGVGAIPSMVIEVAEQFEAWVTRE